MVRPFFLRCLRFKSSEDLLQLFEQLRKNLKLNLSGDKLSDSEHRAMTKQLKRDFYDGVMRDLIAAKAYKVAHIIYGEKQREKFEPTVDDSLIGMEIFSAQLNIDEYKPIF